MLTFEQEMLRMMKADIARLNALRKTAIEYSTDDNWDRYDSMLCYAEQRYGFTVHFNKELDTHVITMIM